MALALAWAWEWPQTVDFLDQQTHIQAAQLHPPNVSQSCLRQPLDSLPPLLTLHTPQKMSIEQWSGWLPPCLQDGGGTGTRIWAPLVALHLII